MKRHLLFLCSLFLLAACEPQKPTPTYEMPRYVRLGKIPVNAATFSVVEGIAPRTNGQFVDGEMPVTVKEAVTQWVYDRTESAGINGEIVFTVTDAHVEETPLERTQGIKGMFTTDQVARFTGRLNVEAQLVNANGRHAEAKAHAVVSKTLAEGATPQERTQLLHELMKSLLASFNTNMAEQMRLRFRP